mmetsp:Transcript_24845/g.58293  ORF Transcript_24845/g.58293 Transcript_24845/m.58293 type:complete len:326 (+) Transcript_24845:192-1169(+)
MNDFPGTPQTLPCSDEDPFFGFHDDSSVDDYSVGVNLGGSSSSAVEGSIRHQEEQSLSCSSKLPHQLKCLRFPNENIASARIIEKQQKDFDHSSKSCRNLLLEGSVQKKRRQFGSKLLSRSNLSKIVKAAVRPPPKPYVVPNRSRWHQNTKNSLNDKNGFYHYLEDEVESRDLENLEDDRSSAVSLPIFSSLTRKLKGPSDSSSSASTSAVQLGRASKLKWNRMLKTDPLATFRKSESSPTAEISSSSSYASSIASCYSAPVASRRVDDGDTQGLLAPFIRRAPSSQEELLNSRVDEEEEEDTDVEDDDHPAAGSFAFAIGRGEC